MGAGLLLLLGELFQRIERLKTDVRAFEVISFLHRHCSLGEFCLVLLPEIALLESVPCVVIRGDQGESSTFLPALGRAVQTS